MAVRKEQAVVDLVIQGRSAETSMKGIQKATFETERLLRNMSKAANPQEYEKLRKELLMLKQVNGELNADLRVSDGLWKKFQTNISQISLGTLSGNLMADLGVRAIGAITDVYNNSQEAFKAYDKSAAELQSATLMSDEVLNQLKQSAKELDGQMGFTAEDYLKAATKIGSAKSELTDNADAMDTMVEKAMLFARAGKLELPEAGEALSMMLNQFGKDANEAGHFVDVMAQGFALGAAELPGMVVAMRYAGVAANSMNVSFGQTNAAVQLLVKNGLTAEMAGTQLRSVLLELGSGADATNPKVVGLEKSLENLAKQNLNTKQMTELFGKENIAGANILLNNLPVLKEWIVEIEKKGAAEKMAAINMSTLEQSQKQYETSLNSLYLLIGEKLQGAFRGMYTVGIQVIGMFKEVIKESDGTIDAIAGIFQVTWQLISTLTDLVLGFTHFNSVGEVVGAIAKTIGYGIKITATAFMFLSNEVIATINTFQLLLQKGKEVMNFFGTKFKIDSNLSLDNIAKQRQEGLNKIGSFWSEPVKNEGWQSKIKTGGYSGETPVGTGPDKPAGPSAPPRSPSAAEKKRVDQEKRDVEKLRDEIFKIRQDLLLDQMDKEGREIVTTKFKYEELRKLAHGNAGYIKQLNELEKQELAALEEKHTEKLEEENIKRAQKAQERKDADLKRALEYIEEDFNEKTAKLEDQRAQELITQKAFQDQKLLLEEEYLKAQMVLQEAYGRGTSAKQNELAKLRRKGVEDERDFEKMIKTQTKDAEHDLLNAKMDFYEGAVSGLRGFIDETTVLHKALFVAEKAIAIAQIIVNLQREISANAAANALLGPAGAPIALAQNTAAKIRAGMSIATIVATGVQAFIPKKKDGGFTDMDGLYPGRSPEGFVNRPTLFNLGSRSYIAGEAGREYVFSNAMLQNPVFANFAAMAESLRTSGFDFTRRADMRSESGSSGLETMMAMLLAEMRRNTAAVERSADKPVDINVRRFEEEKQRLYDDVLNRAKA